MANRTATNYWPGNTDVFLSCCTRISKLSSHTQPWIEQGHLATTLPVSLWAHFHNLSFSFVNKKVVLQFTLALMILIGLAMSQWKPKSTEIESSSALSNCALCTDDSQFVSCTNSVFRKHAWNFVGDLGKFCARYDIEENKTWVSSKLQCVNLWVEPLCNGKCASCSPFHNWLHWLCDTCEEREFWCLFQNLWCSVFFLRKSNAFDGHICIGQWCMLVLPSSCPDTNFCPAEFLHLLLWRAPWNLKVHSIISPTAEGTEFHHMLLGDLVKQREQQFAWCAQLIQWASRAVRETPYAHDVGSCREHSEMRFVNKDGSSSQRDEQEGYACPHHATCVSIKCKLTNWMS